MLAHVLSFLDDLSLSRSQAVRKLWCIIGSEDFHGLWEEALKRQWPGVHALHLDASARVSPCCTWKDLFLRVHLLGKPRVFATEHHSEFMSTPLAAESYSLEVFISMKTTDNIDVVKELQSCAVLSAPLNVLDHRGYNMGNSEDQGGRLDYGGDPVLNVNLPIDLVGIEPLECENGRPNDFLLRLALVRRSDGKRMTIVGGRANLGEEDWGGMTSSPASSGRVWFLDPDCGGPEGGMVPLAIRENYSLHFRVCLARCKICWTDTSEMEPWVDDMIGDRGSSPYFDISAERLEVHAYVSGPGTATRPVYTRFKDGWEEVPAGHILAACEQFGVWRDEA